MKYSVIYTLALSVGLALTGCADKEQIMLKDAPGNPSGTFSKVSLIDPAEPQAMLSILSEDKQKIELELQIPQGSQGASPKLKSDDLETIVSKYCEFKKLKYTDYRLLPSKHYTAKVESKANSARSLAGDKVESYAIQVALQDYTQIELGAYILPIVLSYQGKEYVHLLQLDKFGSFTPISAENKKPIPTTVAGRTEPMKMVAFVETNDVDPRNLGNFLLKDSKKPVFDFVVLFAANMNYDAVKGRRYLSFNDKLQPIVNNPEIYIKYLQDRGIKVLIDILPNHQGVGYENFQSYEEALDFAREVKMWTDKLGVDGWDMDEEYAKYGIQPHLELKHESAYWYMKAMKELMPDKLLTLYEFDFPYPSHGQNYNDYVDFSWADYTVSSRSSYGISNHKYFSRSIEASLGRGTWSIDSYARSNISDGYAGQMIFNIPIRWIKGSTAVQNLSKTTRVFYGEDVIFSGPYFVGPKGE